MRNITFFGKSAIILLAINLWVFQSLEAQNFTKITASPLVSEVGGFLGVAWGDYNNDGYIDLFIANYQSPNLLFQNNGDGSFSKITTGEIVNVGTSSYSASWGDYDNDGDLDIFVANRFGGNFFYRNEGNGFTWITNGSMGTDQERANSASWGDYDQDGHLDLFVANVGTQNSLYHNEGNGEFTKVTNNPIVTDQAVQSVVGLWADYDNDGDLDLYVVNGNFSYSANYLYRNEGQGNFTKITTGRIVADVEGSTGGSWGDYDNDGFLDIYVCNSVNNAPNSLYHNNGDGTFTKMWTGDLIKDMGHSVGSSWVDYDNDGDLDLFVVNVFGARNQLYQNNGDGTFTKILTGAIVTDSNWSFGCGWADYDNDGDLDVVVTNGGISQSWSNFFYRNDQDQNNWITLHCKGTASNTSAIGAVVRVKAIIAGKAVWQMQQISGQTGFWGQNSLDAEFGLGEATIIDSIVIKWPSGIVQELSQIEPNQILQIVETSAIDLVSEQIQTIPTDFILANNYPNPFNPETTIEYNLSKTGLVRLEIFNILGQKQRTLVDQYQAAGTYQVVWDGKNILGEVPTSGIYLYRITTDAASVTRQMVLLR